MERIPLIVAIFFFLNLLKYITYYIYFVCISKKKKKLYSSDIQSIKPGCWCCLLRKPQLRILFGSLLYSNVLPNHYGHFSSIMNRLCIRFYFTCIHVSFVSFLSANIYSSVLSSCFTFICIEMYVTHYPRGCT